MSIVACCILDVPQGFAENILRIDIENKLFVMKDNTKIKCRIEEMVHKSDTHVSNDGVNYNKFKNIKYRITLDDFSHTIPTGILTNFQDLPKRDKLTQDDGKECIDSYQKILSLTKKKKK